MKPRAMVRLPPPPTITILGIPIHDLTYDEALVQLEALVASGEPHQVVTVNPEFLVVAQEQPQFRRVLQAATLALADGAGLQVGALLQGRRFRSRVAGSELLYRLAPLAAAKGWRLFFLGAAPGVAAQAAATLQASHPGLQVEVNPADPTPEGTAAALVHIQATRPQVLLVAYGAPRQDLWIAEHGTEAGVPVMMGIGGGLDYVAGTIPRAPALWRRLGLEWLYRLWQQPWRWRRQLRLLRFLWLLAVRRLH
jgi:N-acetylglucosaminyldiphosphoundecaprenol N-acetyl-beta-D-mannosaminyltransferase